MSSDAAVPKRPLSRVSGLGLIVLFVAVGLGASSVLYRRLASKLDDDAAAARGALPRTPEGRLERWIGFVEPGMHRSLQQLRLSPDRPWIVTHTRGSERNAADQEIWGIDLASVSTDLAHREDLDVVVELPSARRLGTGTISGDIVRHVPHVKPGDPPFDADARARQIVEWSLERVASPLSRDIEGAKLVVRIGSPQRQVTRDG